MCGKIDMMNRVARDFVPPPCQVPGLFPAEKPPQEGTVLPGSPVHKTRYNEKGSPYAPFIQFRCRNCILVQGTVVKGNRTGGGMVLVPSCGINSKMCRLLLCPGAGYRDPGTGEQEGAADQRKDCFKAGNNPPGTDPGARI